MGIQRTENYARDAREIACALIGVCAPGERMVTLYGETAVILEPVEYDEHARIPSSYLVQVQPTDMIFRVPWGTMAVEEKPYETVLCIERFLGRAQT